VLLETLLCLQELDLKIEALKMREVEIPKQKGKYEIHRKRMVAELEAREAGYKKLAVEQHECEGEIAQMQSHIDKYNQQLYAIKKNEEYQALLHEIDVLKKQIGLKEERILAILMEMDDAKARLEEDKKRIDAELRNIDRECAAIDAELEAAVKAREALEADRAPLKKQIAPDLLLRYQRIRRSKKSGPAVVALNDEVCTGCNMAIPPQIANEVLEGGKMHTCNHCGRLLYSKENFPKSQRNE